MKRLFAALLLLGLAGCGQRPADSTPSPQPMPAPVAAAPATTAPPPTPAVAEPAAEAATPAANPTTLSFLHTEGRHLVNEQGQIVQLRGVNIGSWLLIEPWLSGFGDQPGMQAERDIWELMQQRFGQDAKLDLIRAYREAFFTEADVRNIAALGLNALRVPVWWRAVSDPDFAGTVVWLDRCIEWCGRNGIYVIIDLHGAPGGQSKEAGMLGERAAAALWSDATNREETVAWWKRIAGIYRDNPTVAGYDLLNEALTPPLEELIAFYDRLYQEIRTVDPKHPLFIEDGIQGFHRLPRPVDMGWTNVVYSFHYYPQNTEQAFMAGPVDLPRFNRIALFDDCPVYVGEFNSIQLDRGGSDNFRRFCEIFDYFGWSWSFWTYRKIEDNRDSIWGLYGFRDQWPPLNLATDSFDTIKGWITGLAAPNAGPLPNLQSALSSIAAWTPFDCGRDPKTIPLLLKDALVMGGGGNTPHFEFQYNPPNIGYWTTEDTLGWTVNIARDDTYELNIRMANNSDQNQLAVWLDGVRLGAFPLPNTHGWRAYRDTAVAPITLTAGRHVIEIGQGDRQPGFVNFQGAWLTPTEAGGVKPAEDEIRLRISNLFSLRAGTPIRGEWFNSPPNLSYITSGEAMIWQIEIAEGGMFNATAVYATPKEKTELAIRIDGQPFVANPLSVTSRENDWQSYARAELGANRIEAGGHTVSVAWTAPDGAGVGNLREVVLTRQKE